MKRCLAGLLALLLTVCMFPGNSLASEENMLSEEVLEMQEPEFPAPEAEPDDEPVPTEELEQDPAQEPEPEHTPASTEEPDQAPQSPTPEPTQEATESPSTEPTITPAPVELIPESTEESPESTIASPDFTEILPEENLILSSLENEEFDPEQESIDYDSSVFDNPFFSEGYVRVEGIDSIPLFDVEDVSAEAIATLKSGEVVYMLGRASEDLESPTARECVFIALADGIQSFWIDATLLFPMEEENVTSYQEGLEEGHFLYLSGSEQPLGIVEVHLLEPSSQFVETKIRIEPLWEGGFPEILGDSSLLDVSSSTTGETLRSILRGALDIQAKSVDISIFQLTTAQLQSAYQALVDEDHSLFYVAGESTIHLLDETVQVLFPSYRMDLDAHTHSLSSIREEAASLVAQIPDLANTQALRVLSLYETFLFSRSGGDGSDAAAFLLDGHGDSHATALALEITLEQAGIPALSVRSEAMGRVWNMAQVDGQWYHIDLFSALQDTILPEISYAYLLCSDTKITAYGHHGWEAPHTAASNTYDALDWKTALLRPLDVQLLHMGALPEIEAPVQFHLYRSLTVQEVLYTGIMAGEGWIDVSSFGLSLSDFSEMFQSFVNDYPELFFISGASMYYPSGGGAVLALVPNYLYPQEVWAPMLADFTAYADKIIAGIPSGASDLEKALYVYDFFALNFSYSAPGNYSHDPYTLFMQKHGVCQAYSLGYKYVLERMGISSTLVTSTSMNHAWNLVMIDGSWYHVDATWADPGYREHTTIEGYVDHSYFLLSDSGIQDDHFSYTPTDLSASTIYDSIFWRDLDSPFSPGGGYWYFVQDMFIRKWSGNPSVTPEKIYELGPWGNLTGVAVYEGGLLFNTESMLYNLPFSGGTPISVYNPQLNSNRSIVGVFRKEDGLYYKSSNVYGGEYPIGAIHLLTNSMLGVRYTKQEQMVVDFVTRIYQMVLGRAPNEEEEVAWMNDMLYNGITGAAACEGFILSPEFTEKNVSNREFVAALYQTCFDRVCSDKELASWSEYLDNGCSRRFVLNGFMSSDEFVRLCANYGIAAGAITLTDPADVYYNATMFVSRLYHVFLNRDAGWDELNSWTDDMIHKGVTGTGVAKGFAYSAEFLGRNLPDRPFVASMYEAMLGRAPSEQEIDSWIHSLPEIGGRDNLYYQFVTAQEFIDLMQSFGINP